MSAAELGDIDPVGLTEIAEAAGVAADTAKKWRERHPDFPAPRGTVSGRDAWMWGDVRRWLVATKRLPHTIRYRWRPGEDAVTEFGLNGDDVWEPLVVFVLSGIDSWQAFPRPALVAMCDEPQRVADEHLQRWHEARERWVREHPDEPMPQHLLGTRDPSF